METNEKKKPEDHDEDLDENQAAKSVIDQIKDRPAPKPDGAKPPPK